jgi:hypothetical protein
MNARLWDKYWEFVNECYTLVELLNFCKVWRKWISFTSAYREVKQNKAVSPRLTQININDGISQQPRLASLFDS